LRNTIIQYNTTNITKNCSVCHKYYHKHAKCQIIVCKISPRFEVVYIHTYFRSSIWSSSMSIVLPLTSFIGVEDLSREVASTAINTMRGNIRLSQTFTQPFNLTALIPEKDKK
jgi:hypothetical protein